MDIKIIKKLGEGVNGTIYLINSSGKEYIYKIEKYISESQPYKDSFIRQVDFDNKVALYHPDKFLKLKSYGFINECKHIQPIPSWIKGKHKKDLVKKNKMPLCSYLIYAPVLKFTLQSIKEKIIQSDKLYFNMMFQLIDQLNILKQSGFTHNDIHDKNIMSNGKDFYIIDYGMIKHKSYQNNKHDIAFKKFEVNDFILLLTSVINNPVFDYVEKNNLPLPNLKVFMNRLKKYKEYDDIIKYIPRGTKQSINDELITFLISILHYDIYKECIGYGNLKFKVIVSEKQLKLLLYCVSHMNDKNYNSILKYIKKNI